MSRHARRALVLASALALAGPLTGCDDRTELTALEAAVRDREQALEERQTLAQNLNALDRSITELERALEEAGSPLRPETAADTVRPHLPKGVALDVAEAGKRLVLWSGGGAQSLSEVAQRLAEHVPLAVAESAELSAPHYRLELVVAPSSEAATAPAPEAPRAFATPPPSTWRSGRKSRELRARIERLDLQLAELAKVLGDVDVKVAQQRALEARRAELSGMDRAATWGPPLARALSSNAPEEATLRFGPAKLELEVRKGDAAALAKALEEEGMTVTRTDGPPARLEVTRR